ncbi:VOC family protein [Arthrobacter sp. AQ5-05]|uniref:VOC family protein n=1 Tax=Arthrobacter sp. AQ5-05 TaxID=2184581 RepID=UPI0012B566C1|nr:VOC family protein [Arthrobacter sp. AQ5-05]
MSAHELDHLAIAVPAWGPAGAVLNRELGARWASGFRMDVFSPCQLAVAQDMRLELLEPGSGEHSFIQRFLSNNQERPAPHHITFKVHDIRAAIAGARDAGIEPVLVNLEYSQWQEAFLHPKDTGLGFLAQMVQTSHSVEELTGSAVNSRSCPWEQSDSAPLRLPLIHGTVASLQQARHVLCNVLGAREILAEAGSLTAAFHWDEGAELLLTETPRGGIEGQNLSSRTHGIHGIVAVPADVKWQLSEHWDELDGLLAEGTLHPELGLSITSVGRVPAVAGP